MQYKKIVKGIFKERPNRFIAKVFVDGKEEVVHVKNTGRCKELLVENAIVYLSVSDNTQRKTKYDLVCVEKQINNGTILINMDSQAPNDMVAEWLNNGGLFNGSRVVKREVKFGNSRFDFYVETEKEKAFIEVKGVTLENEGVALFPDAPTQRGVKHITELCKCVSEGYSAYVVFVVQMCDIKVFMPNDETHKSFGDALRLADKSGVKIIAVDSIIGEDFAFINNYIDVVL